MSDSATMNPWEVYRAGPLGPPGGAPAAFGPPEANQIPNAYGRSSEPAGPPAPPPAEPGFLQRAWRSIGTTPIGGAAVAVGEDDGLAKVEETARKMMSWDGVTGQGRSEFPEVPNLFTAGPELAKDFPEWSYSPDKFGPLLGAYLSGARGDQLAAIAHGVLPGSTLRMDKHGNDMIDFRGKSYYLAKPGFGAQDAIGAVGQAGIAFLTALGTRKLPFGTGNRGFVPGLISGVTQGGAQGAAEFARGQGIRALGGETGSTPAEMLFATLGGGLGDAAQRIGGHMLRAFQGKGKLFSTDFDGLADTDPVTAAMLTTTGKHILSMSGFQPSDLNVGQAKSLARTLGLVVDETAKQPGGHTARAAVQSARENVPLSAGTLLRRGDLSVEESSLMHGEAAPVMQAFKKTQSDALAEAAERRLTSPRSQTDIGADIGVGVEQRGFKLAADEKAAWEKVDDLTRASERRRSGGLLFDADLNREVLKSVGQMRYTNMVDVSMPNAMRARTAIANMLQRRDPNTGQMVPIPFNLGTYAELRRNIGIWARDANPRGTEKLYLDELKRTLDRSVDDAVANGMISGDPNRLDMLKDAFGASRREFQFWDPKVGRAAAFMKDMRDGKLNGQQIANALYGAGQLNAGGPATQILSHLEQQFGKGSQVWRDVQQAALRRTLLGPQDSVAALTPAGLDARIERVLTGQGKLIMDQLGVPMDGLKELQAFAKTMRSADLRNSGTAANWAQEVKRFVNRIPLLGPILRNTMPSPIDRAQLLTGNGLGARLTPNMFGAGRERVAPPLVAPGAGLLGSWSVAPDEGGSRQRPDQRSENLRVPQDSMPDSPRYLMPPNVGNFPIRQRQLSVQEERREHLLSSEAPIVYRELTEALDKNDYAGMRSSTAKSQKLRDEADSLDKLGRYFRRQDAAAAQAPLNADVIAEAIAERRRAGRGR